MHHNEQNLAICIYVEFGVVVIKLLSTWGSNCSSRASQARLLSCNYCLSCFVIWLLLPQTPRICILLMNCFLPKNLQRRSTNYTSMIILLLKKILEITCKACTSRKHISSWEKLITSTIFATRSLNAHAGRNSKLYRGRVPATILHRRVIVPEKI